MSIERSGKQSIPTCDCCSCELPACATYISAMTAMRENSWQRRRGPYDADINGYYYEDVCPECRELEAK